MDAINKLESKIDRINDDTTELKVIMARNTNSLEDHMRRTTANEEFIQIVRAEAERNKVEIIQDIEPIKSHVAFMKGAAWSLGIAGSIIFALEKMGILAKLF